MLAVNQLALLEALQAVKAEVFNGEACHHAACENCTAEKLVPLFWVLLGHVAMSTLLSKKAHECASKAVACARWVDNGVDEECRSEECATWREKNCAVFAALDDDGRWAHSADDFSSASDVLLTREKKRFAFVNRQDVDAAESFLELFELAGDPEVHAVASDEAWGLHLIKNALLKNWVDVCQEDMGCFGMGWAELWIEVFEHVQSSGQGLRFVHVVVVRACPVEGLTWNDLNARNIDLTG